MADWVTVTDHDGNFQGKFDYEKATEKFVEWQEFDGNNHISVNTGSQWDHQQLILTAGGRWVLYHWAMVDGVLPHAEFVTDTEAARWLIRNKHDDRHEHYFGTAEEGPEPNLGGRPYVGPQYKVRLTTELAEAVDADAAENGWSRSETIRIRLAEAYGLEDEEGDDE